MFGLAHHNVFDWNFLFPSSKLILKNAEHKFLECVQCVLDLDLDLDQQKSVITISYMYFFYTSLMMESYGIALFIITCIRL